MNIIDKSIQRKYYDSIHDCDYFCLPLGLKIIYSNIVNILAIPRYLLPRYIHHRKVSPIPPNPTNHHKILWDTKFHTFLKAR